MTFVPKHRCHLRRTPSWGRICLGAFSLFSLLLILCRSEIAIQYITRGLLLCAKTVIPALFPFMVLSEIIVTGRFLERPLGRVTRPLGRLLRLPAAGCTAVILGLVCGFPVGAKCATLAFREGILSKSEAERTVAIANAPSSAFLISAVGVTLWENRSFGTALYLCVLCSSLSVGILLARLAKKEEKAEEKCDTVCSFSPRFEARLFTDAIASATHSILLVCAYVIFFSALVGTLGTLLEGSRLSGEGISALFALFELSSGVSRIAALGNTLHAAILTALAVGWSGLSVHCQVLSICDGSGISLSPYLLARILSAILCALLFGILIFFCPELTVPAVLCKS